MIGVEAVGRDGGRCGVRVDDAPLGIEEADDAVFVLVGVKAAFVDRDVVAVAEEDAVVDRAGASVFSPRTGG